MSTNNLGLPQLTSGTADKPGMVNDIAGLIDASITSALVYDVSVDRVIALAQFQNVVKLIASGVPAAGSTLTLAAGSKLLIIGNDGGSAGNCKFTVGTSSVTVAPGGRAIVHMDGTQNGIEVVGGGVNTLAKLLDVDLTVAPTNGQALIFSAATGKWKAGNVAAGGGGGGGGGTPGPAIVQNKAAANSAPFAFAAAPKSGNIIVLLMVYYSYQSGGKSIAGFNTLYNVNPSGTGNCGVAILAKVSDGTEQNIALGDGVQYDTMGYELSGVKLDGAVTAVQHSSGNPVTINAAAGGLVLGSIATSHFGGFAAATGFATVPTGTTADSNQNANGEYVQGWHDSAASGSTTYTPTYHDGNSDDYLAVVALNPA